MRIGGPDRTKQEELQMKGARARAGGGEGGLAFVQELERSVGEISQGSDEAGLLEEGVSPDENNPGDRSGERPVPSDRLTGVFWLQGAVGSGSAMSGAMVMDPSAPGTGSVGMTVGSSGMDKVGGSAAGAALHSGLEGVGQGTGGPGTWGDLTGNTSSQWGMPGQASPESWLGSLETDGREPLGTGGLSATGERETRFGLGVAGAPAAQEWGSSPGNEKALALEIGEAAGSADAGLEQPGSGEGAEVARTQDHAREQRAGKADALHVKSMTLEGLSERASVERAAKHSQEPGPLPAEVLPGAERGVAAASSGTTVGELERLRAAGFSPDWQGRYAREDITMQGAGGAEPGSTVELLARTLSSGEWNQDASGEHSREQEPDGSPVAMMEGAWASSEFRLAYELDAVEGPDRLHSPELTGWMERVYETVEATLEQQGEDGGRAVIALDDAELGQLHIELSVSGGQVSLNIWTDREGSRQQLQEGQKQLAQELERHAFHLGQFNVGMGAQGGNGGRRGWNGPERGESGPQDRWENERISSPTLAARHHGQLHLIA